MTTPPTLDIEELERLEKAATPGIDLDTLEKLLDVVRYSPIVEAMPARASIANLHGELATLRPRAAELTEIVGAQSQQLFDVNMENTRLREALKAAEEFVQNEVQYWENDRRSRDWMAPARSTLALIRSALGTEGEGE